MSLSRNGNKAGGSHSAGPLYGRDGFFEDLPLGIVDQARSPYKVYYEDFKEGMAAHTEMTDAGWDGRRPGRRERFHDQRNKQPWSRHRLHCWC